MCTHEHPQNGIYFANILESYSLVERNFNVDGERECDLILRELLFVLDAYEILELII
jgi:hypothetical protein